jgi:hypothetical protein
MLSNIQIFQNPGKPQLKPQFQNQNLRKKSGDLKYFQKIFSSSDTHKNIFSSNYASFWWSSKFYSFQSIKTSKMFQNLKSGDLLNFPQKSLGSDILLPQKCFMYHQNYYCLLLFKFQKVSKN